MSENDKLIPVKDVATRLGVSENTVWRWTKNSENGFPKCVKLGTRTTRWKLSEILAWQQKQEQAA